MRFGETRDPAPTTMEELAPGGLLARLSRMDVLARRAVRGARSGERRSRKSGGVSNSLSIEIMNRETTFGLWTGMCLPVWIGW